MDLDHSSTPAIDGGAATVDLNATVPRRRGETTARAVEFDARGDGPTLVLVPGSCSTGAAWRSVTSYLSPSHRCVTERVSRQVPLRAIRIGAYGASKP